MTMRSKFWQILLLSSSLPVALLALPATTPQVVGTTINEDNEFVITVVGPEGEYRLECADDLTETDWGSACSFSANGVDVSNVAEPIKDGAKFYRLVLYPTQGEDFLTNPYAQALQASSNYSQLRAVFGLPDETIPTIPTIQALPSASFGVRAYAAVIATLSQQAEAIHTSYAASRTIEEVVAALIADIASGAIDGTGIDTNPIEIGFESGIALQAYDFGSEFSVLSSNMSGIRGLSFQSSGGTYTPSVPANWGAFYWDGALWQ